VHLDATAPLNGDGNVSGGREDGGAVTHLTEVKLSPACETKEELEEGEGCCRALEEDLFASFKQKTFRFSL